MNDLADTQTDTVRNYADLNGTRLYYEARGRGAPVVLIEGICTDVSAWDPQWDVLAAEHRVIRFDLRGQGRSNGVTGAFSLVDDLRALLDHLEIPRAHLLGMSLGGWLTYEFAVAHPDRTRSMTLLGAYVPRVPPTARDARRSAHVQLALREGLETGLRAHLQDPLFATAREIPEVIASLSAMTRTHLLQGAGALFVHLQDIQRLDPPAFERLSEIRLPALVLVGELDLEEYVSGARELATSIAGAEHHIVLGAGHVINAERPAQVNALVTAFLRAQ